MESNLSWRGEMRKKEEELLEKDVPVTAHNLPW